MKYIALPKSVVWKTSRDPLRASMTVWQYMVTLPMQRILLGLRSLAEMRTRNLRNTGQISQITRTVF